ncbi:phage tail tape measure protein [Staphylococcus equorum]|uniref:lysostaphin n=1 Tax=Staphylococcus equorum TaxID=246432 RepID=A0A9X4QYJ1_9STAP|nr:phage tail tape measure protein [Staphylococcus equorum]MDG0818986.1 phage tail tape measure protein [Staphylococcus equorum]MDG0839627.1 phage tail tape measure protein [Staphylococcus equorum]MDG0844647.1 phage tail tape measure protein [Staphylococcus equorum]
MDNIQGYAIKNTMDNTDVEQGMKGLKRQMGVLSSEVKANMSSFGKAEKSVQKYQIRIDGLNNKMKVQKKMYDQTKSDLNNVKSAYEKASNSIKQQEQKVKELAEAHKKQDDAMRKSNQEMKKSNKELDNAKTKQSVLSAEKAKAKTKLDDLRSAERRLKESGKASTEQIKQASNATKQQREVHQKLIASHKEETANVKKLTQSNKGITEENKKVKASYQQSNDAVKTAEKEYNKLSKTIKDYPKDLAKAEKAVNNEKASMNGLQKSINKAEQELKQMNKQQMVANSSYTKQADHLDKMSEKYGKMSQNMRSVGRNMSMYVTTPIAGAMGYAGKLGVEFDDGMRKVQAISGATGKDLDALKAKAREMGATTKFSASDSAEAMNYMAMAGWKSQDMMSGLPGIMDLAAASGEELGIVSDIVTDGLTAFGLEAKDSGHFADVLAAASANANTNVQMMGDGFKYAAPVAGALGYSIEDTSMAIGLMSNAGIKGEKAGTALRTMFTNLSKPTKAMKDKMDELGISITDSNGEMLPMRDVLDQLRDKFSGLSKDQQAAAAATIFGKESMSGALAVINASQKDYDKLSKSIDGSKGSAKDMADTMEKGLGGSLRELRSAAEELGLSIFETIQPALSGMVGGLKSTVDFLNDLPKGAKVAGVAIAGVAAAIGPVTLGIGLLLRAVQAAAGGYAQLNRRMAENTAEAAINAGATKANAGAIATSGKSAKGSAGLFGRLGKSTGKAAGKVSLLGQASKVLGNGIKILGGPIGWIITGVTLLGGAFTKAYNNVDWFKKGVDGLFDVIKTFGGGAISKFSSWINDLGDDFVKAQSKNNEFVKEFKSRWDELTDDVKPLFKKIGSATDKATDTTKVLGDGVSKETKKALGSYVKYSQESNDILNEVKYNHGKITQDKANELIDIEQKLSDDLIKKFEKRKEDEINNINEVYEMSKDLSSEKEKLTEEEYQSMLQKTEQGNNARIQKEQQLNKEIKKMKEEFSADGKLDKNELKQLAKAEQMRRDITIDELSKSQKEQQKILDRMDSNEEALSIKKASRNIKDAEKAKKKRIDEIDDEYTDRKLSIQQNEDLSNEDKEIQLGVLEQWKKEETKKTEDKKKEVVGIAKDQNEDIETEMDLSNGRVYSNSEKWWNKTKEFLSDDSIWQGIKNGASGLGEWFSEQGQEFGGALHEGWNIAIENGGDLWKSLTGWLGEKWEDTKTWFSQKGQSIWSNIKIGWNNGLETGGNLWSSLTGWLGEKWEETKTWFSQKGGHIWSNIKSGWNNALETGGNLWSSITNKLGESWENTKGWFSEKGQNIQQSFKNGWNSAWDTAGNIWGKVTKGVSDTWENVKTSTRDKLEEAKGTATDKTKGIWKNTSKWFGDTYNSAKDKVTGVYTKTRDKFTDAAGKVWDKSKSAYDGTKKWFGETYEKAKTKVTGVYNQAKGKFTDTASTAWDKSKSTWKGTSKYFGQAYSSVKTNVSNMWGKAKTSFGNIAGEGWKKAKSVYKGFKKWLGDTLQWIKDVGADMGKAAGDLGKKVANKAIGGLNGMIGGVNKISKAITGKDKLIQPIDRLSTGTYDGSSLATDSNGGLRQPTVAMVNDKGPGNGPGGRTQELIQRKDGSIDAPQGKNTIVGLGKGDGVINARHTHKLQEQGVIPKRLSTGTGTKIPRFSKGSPWDDLLDGVAKAGKNMGSKISDGYHSAKKAGSDAKDTVKDLGSKGLEKVKDGASWLGDKIGDVWDYVKHPGKLVNKVMDSIGINFGGGDNATVNLVKAAYKNLKSSLVDKVKDWFTEAEGGDGDASWLLKHPVLQTFGNYTGGLMFNGGKHYGMDFGMPTGTKIKALTDGKISQAGAVAGGGGNQITLDEPGGKWYQWYMHMSKIIAKKGQKVSAGDVIGLSGSTGNSTTPHLHIQRMKGYPSNETAVNPKKWLESLQGGNQNKSAQKWSGDIKKTAKRMGVSLSGTDLKDVISLINTESNGNAGVTQQVQDQNSGGNEAQGLLQYTPGTFGSYAVKGHKNIKNGYDQLLAFFNNKSWRGNLSAWKSRMASGLTGWGPTGPRKYENGGISTTHKLAEISERNRAEAIIPLHKSKRNRAVGLMEKAMTAIGMDNGSANVTVNNDNSTMEKLLQQVVQLNDTNNRMQQTIIKLLSGNNNNMSKNEVMNIFSQLLGSKANLDNFNQGF